MRAGMLGWRQRSFIPFSSQLFPPLLGQEQPHSRERLFFGIACLCVCFLFSLGVRLLEIPYWQNPAYTLGNEYLLATHDAYHWIAGAEGFEFGAGHPMSELVGSVAGMFGIPTANAGFWLAPVMGSLVGVTVFLWGWAFGFPCAGFVAGVLTSLSPAFLARTLLGFYDTDLVVLSFAILLGLVPAIWVSPWLITPAELLASLCAGKKHLACVQRFFIALQARWVRVSPAGVLPGPLSLSAEAMQQVVYSPKWLAALLVWGVFGYSVQEWHSLFPYLTRFSALLLPTLILVFGPQKARRVLLQASLCHVLPLVAGLPGALLAGAWAWALVVSGQQAQADHEPSHDPSRPSWAARLRQISLRVVRHKASLWVLWGVALVLVMDAQVFAIMRDSFRSYVNRSGDVSPLSAVSDPVVFPSVAQSIIEVQEVNLDELLSYIYPAGWVIAVSLFFFAVLVLIMPAFLWFVPLLALAFLSIRMGGRMTMFGAPPLMLAFALGGGAVLGMVWEVAERLCQKCLGRVWRRVVALGAALCVVLFLAWPLAMLLPNLTQGPVISQQHAQALQFIRHNTPEDSIVWNWWDWGYAVHHFSHRTAIADGARHGGPSLYLPAAVYTTADPRFARQLIKYTASKGNDPGNVFEGLTGTQAQELMEALSDKTAPLVEAPGKQYIVLSFEHLRLGIWINKYGSWNFIRKSGPGSLMNNLATALEFNMETGQVAAKGGKPVQARSISLFHPSGITRQTYAKGGNHFIFNLENATMAEEHTEMSMLARFWKNRVGYFGFTAPSNDKLVVDDVFYYTLMVQLLVAPPDDPRFAPYFRLVYDNVYARVYEVL
ncbi:STT3 domain-containing protein [Desulfovibrio cuneatus]|uniref:STT3 domain-containing protein n=1 Tax=Desulfovibrio cuneatus TaxID=159728 RepID=UPI001FE199C8|nr:STT3 domain-containing protein [Desulfovibrio cuneatus]